MTYGFPKCFHPNHVWFSVFAGSFVMLFHQCYYYQLLSQPSVTKKYIFYIDDAEKNPAIDIYVTRCIALVHSIQYYHDTQGSNSICIALLNHTFINIYIYYFFFVSYYTLPAFLHLVFYKSENHKPSLFLFLKNP